MTDANAILKYKHLTELIAGKLKTGNPVRDDLIVSDAERHLSQLISVRPNIDFEGDKKEEAIVDNLNDERVATKPKKIKKISKGE